MVAARLMPNLLDAVEPSGSPDDGKVEFRLGSELQFRTQLGAAVDSVDPVKRALDTRL